MVPGPAWGYSRMVGEGSGESSHGRQDTHGCSLHKAAATSSGRAPHPLLTGQAQPHSQTEDGQDGTGQEMGQAGSGSKPEAGPWCPGGVVYYNSISQGRRQQHTRAPSP